MWNRTIPVIIYCTFVLFAISRAEAGVGGAAPINDLISYQGQLLENGEAVTGEVFMEFQLFEDDLDPEPIGTPWSATVQVIGGLFMAEMYFGPDIPWGEELYLQITVNGTPLNNLQRITSVPSAFVARAADSADTVWQVDGSSIYYNQGHVGIGTDSPLFPLHLNTTSPSILLDAQGGTSSFLRFRRNGDAESPDNNYIALSSANGSLVTRVGGGDRFRILTSGQIGIGLNSPLARLHINAGNDEPDDMSFRVSVNTVDRFSVGEDGNYFQRRLGIGRAPGVMLDVDAPASSGALRVAIAGTTRLNMGPNGGLSVGSAVAAADLGLRVQGATNLNGQVALGTTGTPGGNPLCLNGQNVIALCTAPSVQAITAVDSYHETALAQRVSELEYVLSSREARILELESELATLKTQLSARLRTLERRMLQ
jgi:hypothetical protein